MRTDTTNYTKKSTPTMFTLAEDGEATPSFQPGKCKCKNCGSQQLDYYAFVEDAKCSECSQWQNESPIDY